MATTLIVPGYKGSGEGHWQRHWLKRDPDAVLVEQENWDDPCLEAWLDRLSRYVKRHPHSTVVAHSLGVPLVVHLAHRFPALDIARALFVAPADVDIRVHSHECFRSFVSLPLERLPFATTVAASRNDPYIAFERAAAFAIAWGARFVDLGYAGHVNIESGYGPWPGSEDLLPPFPVTPIGTARASFASGINY